MEDKIYQLARRRVKAKKGFYQHLNVYITVGAFFFLMKMITFRDPFMWNFIFPMLLWTVGLTIHYFSVFGLPGSDVKTDAWEERELEREARRLRAEMHRRLEDEVSGYEEYLELRDVKKQRARPGKSWDDNDLV